VPGASTKRFNLWVKGLQWGRNRIDVRGKGMAFVRHGTHRYRANKKSANDNEAFAVAA
jgi:hypothetical protein